VLPLEVPFADAAENPRRLALLLAGLESGAPELLADGLADRLHCERRLDLVPGSRGVLCAALAAGAYGATLSGSGSAQVALASREAAPKVAEAMAEAFRAATGRGTGAALEIVLGAPRVEPRGDPREGRESKV
jgi:homoserine kinase